MKIRVRKPSISRSFKARTTGKITRSLKSSVNPLYGKKGMGYINDPKRAVKNAIYSRTTTSVYSSASRPRTNARSKNSYDAHRRGDPTEQNRSTSAGRLTSIILLIIGATWGGKILIFDAGYTGWGIFAWVISFVFLVGLLFEFSKRKNNTQYRNSSPLEDRVVMSRPSTEQSRSIVDLHFSYNESIATYYKQRETSPSALAEAKEYCKKDIALFPELIELLKQSVGFLPRCPSFQQLAVIYEKEGSLTEAIDVCKLAVEYGLEDGTKGGFVGRLKRLEKKQAK